MVGVRPWFHVSAYVTVEILFLAEQTHSYPLWA